MVLTAFLRTIFFYFFLLTVLRLLGKRELGALGPLDLVVTIIMAEAAAIPIENPHQSIWLGIVPIVTLMFLEIILSYLCLVNEAIRRIVCGVPTVVIKDGHFKQSEMRRMRYSINDLLEQLRQKGVDNVSDVELAILESDGGLSVIPRAQSRPIVVEDMGLPLHGKQMAKVLVIDGEIEQSTLQTLGLSEEDLRAMLAHHGYPAINRVFFASIDANNDLHVQLRS